MSRRHARLRIALAVILCLLFQQVAVAAYACTVPDMTPSASAMADECADMGMEVVQEVPTLCAEHCSPDDAALTVPSAPQVPPVALPPLQFAYISPPSATQAWVVEVPIERSDPPPRLRYCSLLI